MSSEPKNSFKSLAPSNSVEDVGSYIEWLDEIINDDSYGNIAVTGDLGIGKSSLIRTFEREKKYKFTYLSASDLGYRSDEKQNLTEEIQSKLEKDLLVQLVSLCKRTDIPESRFRTVPENESRCSKIMKFAYSSICGLTVMCVLKLLANFLLSDVDYWPKLNFVPLQLGVIVTFLGLSSTIFVHRLLKNYQLSKLSLGKEKSYSASAEIDIKNLEPEALDTNLHEILYLFERIAEKESRNSKTSMPVFIIEDLDRYRSDICLPILTKLKQINNMLNNRYRNQHEGYGIHYKFIYLLNDRIFDASEKDIATDKNIPYNYEDAPYKFFDIIIPVLPKLGFTNSSDTIRKRFEEYKIKHDFINDICYYVYDYRKLNDIENEFKIYNEHFIDNESITPTKLLAFVIYKVFYKAKYDQLYKAKDGAPKSELLKFLLMPDVYKNGDRTVETFESILEKRFQDVLFDILQMTEDLKNKYKSEIVENDTEKDYSRKDLSGLDLSRQDLHGRNFANSDLRGANLSEANLRGANLSGVNLNRVTLFRTNLNEANLDKANLNGAYLAHSNLIKANLNEATLIGANLREANLRRANLSEANLIGVNLNRADLCGANLFNAKLKAANLQHSKYNYKTIFPKNFDPKSRGMVEEKNETAVIKLLKEIDASEDNF